MTYPSDVAFTPAVKAIQSRKGSRDAYARMETSRGWQTEVTEDLAGFIAEQRSVFLGSVSSDGAPYIQHRGGPPGFIKVIGPTTLAFVDFKGNRQFISQGNFEENPKAHLFLIDYANKRRVKIWGEARVVEGDDALVEQLMPEGYKARPEQVIVFEISAWDINCPQHIPQRFEAEDVAEAIETRDARIAELEAEVARLKAAN